MLPLGLRICELTRQVIFPHKPNTQPGGQHRATVIDILVQKGGKVVQSNSEIEPVPFLAPGPALWEWLSVALHSTVSVILPSLEETVSCLQPNQLLSLFPAHKKASLHFELSLSLSIQAGKIL